MGVEKMNKIEVINYDFDKIYEFVRENIYSCRTAFTKVDNARFHHNIDYKHVCSAMEYGILSYINQKKMIENRELTADEKYRFGDDYHVNGINYISLSTLDVNMNNIRDDEWLYDYKSSESVDILISSDVKTYKNTTNYFNEFLVEDIIPTKDFKAIDLRMLKYNNKKDDNEIKKLINKYNCLRDIANMLNQKNLGIPLRERSEVDFDLDIKKVKALPELRVK